MISNRHITYSALRVECCAQVSITVATEHLELMYRRKAFLAHTYSNFLVLPSGSYIQCHLRVSLRWNERLGLQ